MRPLLSACLLALCAAALAPAASLTEARTRWLKGNYEEAETEYEALLKEPKHAAAAAVGLSRALDSQGKYDKALEALAAAVKKHPADADVLARHAEMLHFRGRWDDADKAVAAALKVNDKHVLARWVKAQLYRDRGDTDKANTEVKAIVRHYSDLLETPQEIKGPEDLVIVGLASAENARWNNIADEFTVILQDLYGDAVKNDKLFWPAELQAGLLLAEKYNRGEALDAFDKALTINPGAAEALVAKGRDALARFEVKDAEGFALRALKINPSLPEALRLRADIHLATGDVKAALKALEQARKFCPRDERILGRLAACHLLEGGEKGEAFTKIVAEVKGFDSKPAVFFYDLGERLEEKRRYTLAEKYFKEAMTARPNLPGPSNSLGMLYMRLGDEEKAEDLLTKGFKADKFNVRVSNSLKVLRHLKEYKEIKTANFIFKYDATADPILGPYMAESLEPIYEELAAKFNYRPKGPFLVELFRNHEMFSGRVVALPDLFTYGACTGRVFALASPNMKGGVRIPPFNWMRVLRHEMVHIFNLAQTDYQVPHWFTEGLAVAAEGFPRPAPWSALLVERSAAGKLLTLDTIDLGFIRPRDAAERTLAYAQAHLYIQHIEKKYGAAAIGRLLAAFAKNLPTAAALKEALKADKAELEKDYAAFVKDVVKKLGGRRDVQARKTLDQLQADRKKGPKDLDVAAELAARLVATPRRADARKLADEVLEKKPTNAKALYALAVLAKRAADAKQEKALLEKALDRDDPEPRVLRALGEIYYDAKELSKAADLLELGRKRDPFDPTWLKELARVYARMDSTDKLIPALKELVANDADDFDRRVRLARLLSDKKDHAGAEKYAREAIEIDITSKDARGLLLKAVGAQGDKRQADLKRLQGLLEPAAKGK